MDEWMILECVTDRLTDTLSVHGQLFLELLPQLKTIWYSGEHAGRQEGSVLPSPPTWPRHLLQAAAQEREPPGPLVQKLPLSSEKNWRRIPSSFSLCLRFIQCVLLELLPDQAARTPGVLDQQLDFYWLRTVSSQKTSSHYYKCAAASEIEG